MTTLAVPCTTIQCSERWWCICMESLPPGLTCSSLTWKRGPMFERLEVAPGPIVAEVLLLLLAVRVLEACDDLGDVLRAVLVGDEQRIGRIDDDRSLTPIVATSDLSECT